MSSTRVTHEHRGRIAFWCPGCHGIHEVIVFSDHVHAEPRWDWNGSRERPTFRPSVRVWSYVGEASVRTCHSFVTDGVIEFLGDCTHGLAGQKRVLQPFPDPYLRSPDGL